MTYKLIAIQIGDLLKYSTSINEINRLAAAIFDFNHQAFPNEAITSQRAQLIYDWILSLASQQIDDERRDQLLIRFCHELSADNSRKEIDRILINANIAAETLSRDDLHMFLGRSFHSEIIKHCKSLFLQGNYFHAVFEACKAYNLMVRDKSQNTKDGYPLMMEVWGWERGTLKVTACITDTDKNVQEGIKFLSAGLMQAVRNPTAHEPALLWPIGKQDCLDILGLISFLLRQLDRAVYFKAQ